MICGWKLWQFRTGFWFCIVQRRLKVNVLASFLENLQMGWSTIPKSNNFLNLSLLLGFISILSMTKKMKMRKKLYDHGSFTVWNWIWFCIFRFLFELKSMSPFIHWEFESGSCPLLQNKVFMWFNAVSEPSSFVNDRSEFHAQTLLLCILDP